MFENSIIFTLFVLAAIYLLRNTFSGFFSKSKAGCAKGCGSCQSVDFEAIAKDMQAKQLPTIK